MRRLVFARAVAAAMGLVLPAAADQPRCPLDLSTCLMEFAKMGERPWVGVLLDQDTTTGVITVTQVLPDGSAAKTPTRARPTACGETRTAAAPPVAIPSHRARRTC